VPLDLLTKQATGAPRVNADQLIEEAVALERKRRKQRDLILGPMLIAFGLLALFGSLLVLGDSDAFGYMLSGGVAALGAGLWRLGRVLRIV
jgi:hypothetical protein